MADQEISKHTKNLLAIAASPSHNVWHKVREICIEVATIVFAVTLSIWLHGLGEHRHEQAQVRAFLLGLKQDLQVDIAQANENVQLYRRNDLAYAKLAKLSAQEPPPSAQFDELMDQIRVSTTFTVQASRYEGFKSSGKLSNIEDTRLLDQILRYYQDALPAIGRSEAVWRQHREQFRNYMDASRDSVPGDGMTLKLLLKPRGKSLCEDMVANPQLYERYGQIIAQAKTIVQSIEQAYPGAPAPAK